MDCRVCGDPNSAMRFAFIEFKEESSVLQVLPLLLFHSLAVYAHFMAGGCLHQEFP